MNDDTFWELQTGVPEECSNGVANPSSIVKTEKRVSARDNWILNTAKTKLESLALRVVQMTASQYNMLAADSETFHPIAKAHECSFGVKAL